MLAFLKRASLCQQPQCSRLENALCLCLPVQPAQAVLECGPKSLAIDFVVKSFDCLLESPLGVIAR